MQVTHTHTLLTPDTASALETAIVSRDDHNPPPPAFERCVVTLDADEERAWGIRHVPTFKGSSPLSHSDAVFTRMVFSAYMLPTPRGIRVVHGPVRWLFGTRPVAVAAPGPGDTPTPRLSPETIHNGVSPSDLGVIELPPSLTPRESIIHLATDLDKLHELDRNSEVWAGAHSISNYRPLGRANRGVWITPDTDPEDPSLLLNLVTVGDETFSFTLV